MDSGIVQPTKPVGVRFTNHVQCFQIVLLHYNLFLLLLFFLLFIFPPHFLSPPLLPLSAFLCPSVFLVVDKVSLCCSDQLNCTSFQLSLLVMVLLLLRQDQKIRKVWRPEKKRILTSWSSNEVFCQLRNMSSSTVTSICYKGYQHRENITFTYGLLI